MPMQQFTPPPPGIAPPDENGQSLCARCAFVSGTCCRTEPKLTALSFPLSISEWQRLLPFASLSVTAAPDAKDFSKQEAAAREAERRLAPPDQGWDIFALEEDASPVETDTPRPPEGGDAVSEYEDNVPEFVRSMHGLFPGEKARIAELFPGGGKHLALRTRADGTCVFLGDSGCRLPRKARPWYCLLFPAWVIHNGLSMFDSPECLIARNSLSPSHGVSLIGINPPLARSLYKRLRHDWGLD